MTCMAMNAEQRAVPLLNEAAQLTDLADHLEAISQEPTVPVEALGSEILEDARMPRLCYAALWLAKNPSPSPLHSIEDSTYGLAARL